MNYKVILRSCKTHKKVFTYRKRFETKLAAYAFLEQVVWLTAPWEIDRYVQIQKAGE